MSENKRTVGKVTASASTYGGITGLFTLSIIWAFKQFWGIEVPEYVAMFIVAIASYVAAIFGGWLVKPGNGEHRGE